MLNFAGVYTAMVTPFKGGKVDYETLAALIEEQIAGGVAGLIPVGTTGESPTLDCDEHLEVIAKTIEIADGRCQIIAGTGANCTAEGVVKAGNIITGKGPGKSPEFAFAIVASLLGEAKANEISSAMQY